MVVISQSRNIQGRCLSADSSCLTCPSNLLQRALALQNVDDRPPIIVGAHGIAGQKDMGLEPFAEFFAARGMAVLLFDYRNFGGSEGEPRNWVSPNRHLQDWAAALDYIRASGMPSMVTAVKPPSRGAWHRGSSFCYYEQCYLTFESWESIALGCPAGLGSCPGKHWDDAAGILSLPLLLQCLYVCLRFRWPCSLQAHLMQAQDYIDAAASAHAGYLKKQSLLTGSTALRMADAVSEPCGPEVHVARIGLWRTLSDGRPALCWTGGLVLVSAAM